MKWVNIILVAIVALGILFIVYIAFQNSSTLVLQALGILFSMLFLAAFLGEQIRRKEAVYDG